MATKNDKPVLVTTEHRGVFFGYLVGTPTKEKVKLKKARNCVYWDTGTRGFLGLASDGPSDKCRVGFAVPEITLYDITSVVTVDKGAVAKWEAAPWMS